jgi:hypothetical protein
MNFFLMDPPMKKRKKERSGQSTKHNPPAAQTHARNGKKLIIPTNHAHCSSVQSRSLAPHHRPC